MAGLVIKDLQGGDFAVQLVNDDMWQQILAVSESLNSSGQWSDSGFSRIVDWLVSEAKEAAPPVDLPGCPRQREGIVVERWRCQWFVAKFTSIQDDIDGIVFVPAY